MSRSNQRSWAASPLVLSAAVAGLVLLIALVVVAATPREAIDKIRDSPKRDAYKYLQMMECGPHVKVPAPFAYRVALPWLGYACGWSPLRYSFAVSWISLLLFGAGVVAIAVRFEIPIRFAIVCLALGLLSGPMRNVYHQAFLTDLPLLAGVTLAGLLASRGRLTLLSLLAACLAANRELSFLLPLPAVLLRQSASRERQEARGLEVAIGLLLILPALMVVVAIRFTVDVQGSFGLQDAVSLSKFPELVFWQGVTAKFVGWLCPLALIACLADRGFTTRVSAVCSGGLMIALTQVLLGSDTQRLALPALPAVVLLAARGLEIARVGAVGIVSLVLLQYASFTTELTDPWLYQLSVYVRPIKYLAAGGSLVALALVVVASKVQRVRRVVTGERADGSHRRKTG